LRPPSLDELGLVGALRARLARFETGGIDSDQGRLIVIVESSDDLDAMTAAIEVAIYRIAEEAMTNVVKHAAASRVTVSLRSQPGSIELSVVDNGVGLPATFASGVGMQSMRERVAELGGRFSVHSGPDSGTELSVWFPSSTNAGEMH
jgi:signal transduction histidine kinase